MTTIATDPTVDPEEVRKFAVLAIEWWNPRGKFAPLHKFNPIRLQIHPRRSRAAFRARPESAEAVRRALAARYRLRRRPALRADGAHGLSPSPAPTRPKRTSRSRAPTPLQSGVNVDYRFTTAEALAAARRSLRRRPQHGSDRARRRSELYLRSCAAAREAGRVDVRRHAQQDDEVARCWARWRRNMCWVGCRPARMTGRGSSRPRKLTRMLKDVGLKVTTTRGVSFERADLGLAALRRHRHQLLVVAEKPLSSAISLGVSAGNTQMFMRFRRRRNARPRRANPRKYDQPISVQKTTA